MADIFEMNEANLNITWAGSNGDLPDALAYDTPDADVKRIATEAVQGGYIPGIPADPTANFADFIVDRFPSNDAVPNNRLMLRPKTPFGNR